MDGFFNMIARLLIMSALLALALSTPAYAQQREFYNGGFEQNDPRGPGNPTFQIYNNADVPEWNDVTGFIELWDSNFQSVPAQEGDVFAEMNAYAPGALYQEVCLAAGETIIWSFAHRARSGGQNPQNVTLEVADNTGAAFQTLAMQSSTIGGGWTVNTGSVVFTGVTGVQRVQFSTTDPGSVGNFVDNLFLDIAAFAEFAASSSSAPEASNAALPSLIINGRVDTTTTIPFTITGGTADAADFTTSASFITVPPGNYRAVAFPLPMTITDNFTPEPNETIDITIGTPSTSEIILAKTQCDGTAPQTASTYTIINDDQDISSTKSVAIFDAVAGPYAIPGNDVIYTISTVNEGNIDLDINTIFMTDIMPSEVAFYNNDIDGPGPETQPVLMETSNTALTFNPATDLGFSNAVAPPTQMSDCNYAPPIDYDLTASIKYICFAPKGIFSAGAPNPSFDFKFRAIIR